MRIEATTQAEETVRRVAEAGRGELVMVLSNGCCDSTAPYLFDSYVPDPDAHAVGTIAGVPVLAPAWLVRLYPDDEALTVDVETGVLDDSFSLETELDRRFVLRAPVREAVR